MSGIIVDASTVLAALMADGRARHALMHTQATLYAPPLLFEEVETHFDLIVTRAKVPREMVRALMADVKLRVATVPAEVLAPFAEDARRRADAPTPTGTRTTLRRRSRSTSRYGRTTMTSAASAASASSGRRRS